MVKLFLSLILLLSLVGTAEARVTPDDIYQAKRSEFTNNLDKISDNGLKSNILEADWAIKEINQSVTRRYDGDMAILAGIVSELEQRADRQKRENPFLENALYWVTFAHEAVAYQKIQDYTPNLSGNSPLAAIKSSSNRLRGDLNTLKGKILKAKTMVKKAVNYN